MNPAAALRHRRAAFRATILPAALLLGALVGADAQAVVVTKATDVCAANADPCNVTTTMDIPDGLCTHNAAACSTNADCSLPGFCERGAVILDFGVRDVNVSGSGKFNFGISSGSILCGDFTATTSGVAIDANGNTGSGSDSGTVRIFSRRKCSAAHLPAYPAPPCTSNGDCALGACDTRRCSLGPTKACDENADCSLGPCNPGLSSKCAGDGSIRCATNADCNLGSCPVQLTCRNMNSGASTVECSTNSDCNFGNCTVGTASITLAGAVVGNSAFPAFLDLRAADNVSISKSINLNGSTADSDGGELSVDATFGSVTLTGNVTATSGGFSTGGDVSLYAGTDVTVSAQIDLTGGDFDGGTIDIDAGRDVAITKSILANSGSGAGFGGELQIVAGRDLSVTGAAANKTTLETNGHANLFNEAGDAGAQDLTADRNLSLGANTRIISNGAAPDATGGDIILDASNNFTFSGDVTAKALGANGQGGTLEAFAGGTMNVQASGTIDLTGGSFDGGDLQLFASGNMTYSGLADVGASNGGSGGAAFLDSDADTTIAGTIRNATGHNGSLDVSACRLTLSSTGKLDAGLTSSVNTLWSRESMKLLSGSLMKAGGGGSNRLIYRAPSKPPQVSGTVTPAAQLIVNAALPPCPVCGNNELDGGETCDDGNTANGDGCNSQCQNEKCVMQTAPKIACTTNGDCGARTCVSGFCSPWDLCEDGNGCTTDTCNTSLNGGTCQHAARNCADSHACTTDSCNATTGECQHVTNDAACNDGNPCTDEVCNAMSGCVPTSKAGLCDDGIACTEDDACSDGQCLGTPIPGCGFCGDGELNGDEVCDDGNATFVNGEYCGDDCAVLIPCGKPTNSSGLLPKTSDAQFTLRAAVGQVTCSVRVCDVNNSKTILVSDAQGILRAAVGQDVDLICPTSE